MTIIDPSPDQDELQQLARELRDVADRIDAYLSGEGRDDPNGDALAAEVLSLRAAAEDVETAELDLAVQNGGAAVDVINAATASLKHAIEVREEITRDLNLVKDVVAFAGAIAAGNVKDILTAGKTLLGDLKPEATPSR
jgi:hypothetical protein